MRGSAIFSADGLYRYELRRVWAPSRPPYCAIMLNPSTADARKNDPTVLRQIKRAVKLGYGSLIVLNVGAGRNTDPRKWKAMDDPIGPLNMSRIRTVFQEIARARGIIVAGWGNHAPLDTVRRIDGIAQRCGVSIHCLGVTAQGHPIHPLYVSYDRSPVLWSNAYLYKLMANPKLNGSQRSHRIGLAGR
jgi:hypothetical protein